ncbi:TetR/AcrR family transcriptional regulator [Pseudonocardia humida]|uniref:TetR/AcrR family transcriptional regulator C-terminal domain-containing protein n=1 Tax=Pseudonocardia humida TaxID=2800819 RepID=A0ABT0ZZD0_9PSEU|nr:TetR/AcrR family transcriptional regulator C-terminal domain-containing protein [Pseudonocardia humida]MCO1656101.1 TetR/AcrR family transcriptional regulator C-terminal domain-containing protein [Pseudonocardia humida]
MAPQEPGPQGSGPRRPGSRSGRGRGSVLTPDRIIDAALRLADGDGDLDRLTVRRLASELGVGAMTLYSYFRSRDDILDGMADHVLGRMRLPAGPAAGPAEAIREVGVAFLDMMREHPTVVRLLGSRVTTSRPALLGAMEAPLQRLVDAGIPGPVAVRCYGFLITYAIGFASYQVPRPWGRAPEPGSGREDDEQRAEARRQRSHAYSAMPIDRFPRLVELAEELVTLPSDEQFAHGLEAFVTATVAQLERDHPPA